MPGKFFAKSDRIFNFCSITEFGTNLLPYINCALACAKAWVREIALGKRLGLRSAALAVALACLIPPISAQTTQQEHVHQMSHNVMPFDISKTVHIFKMTELGGVERVVTREAGASDQVALIQMHLRHEAEQFQKGNYSDPAKLHGEGMPGLKELQEGASHIKVSYTTLPNVAEIKFETTDLHLLTAIHRWFGAQLSEHGADAKAE